MCSHAHSVWEIIAWGSVMWQSLHWGTGDDQSQNPIWCVQYRLLILRTQSRTMHQWMNCPEKRQIMQNCIYPDQFNQDLTQFIDKQPNSDHRPNTMLIRGSSTGWGPKPWFEHCTQWDYPDQFSNMAHFHEIWSQIAESKQWLMWFRQIVLRVMPNPNTNRKNYSEFQFNRQIQLRIGKYRELLGESAPMNHCNQLFELTWGGGCWVCYPVPVDWIQFRGRSQVKFMKLNVRIHGQYWFLSKYWKFVCLTLWYLNI